MELEVNTADPAKNALASARQAELDAPRRRGITDSSTEAWTNFKRQDMRKDLRLGDALEAVLAARRDQLRSRRNQGVFLYP